MPRKLLVAITTVLIVAALWKLLAPSGAAEPDQPSV